MRGNDIKSGGKKVYQSPLTHDVYIGIRVRKRIPFVCVSVP